MKKIAKITVLMFLMASLTISQNAHSRTGDEIVKDMTKASKNALKTYKKNGVSGLVNDTQTCYSEVKNKFYCLYVDLASHRVDEVISTASRFPQHEFFSSENFLERAAPILVSVTTDREKTNEYLSNLIVTINSIVDRQLQ